MNIFKSIIILIITIFITITVSAQYTWDEQPSNCNEHNRRAIGVQVKSESNSIYKITVYKGSQKIHGSHPYNFTNDEEKRITLDGIPSGEFTVFLERAERIVSFKKITFKPCSETFEDIIVWKEEPSGCDQNERRSVSVDVYNKSNEAHQYKITVYDGEQFKHGGRQTTILSNGAKTISLGGMPKLGYYQVRIERDGEVVSSKNYRFRACDAEEPAEVKWAVYPTNCDQNNNRSIDVAVKNNSKHEKSFAIKIYKQDNSFVHGGRNIPIAAKGQKTLSLHGIPAGYFRVQIVSGDKVVSSTNYVFERCKVSSSEINNLTQTQNFEPFFTQLESSFTINLSNYFKSNECDNINYSFKKLSPGINYQLSGTMLSVVPTPSFLGKTLLEITAQCGNRSLVENITIHTQAPSSLLQKYNVQFVNVGGLIFDPLMPQYGNKLCHQAYNWADPMALSEAYIDAMTKASGNYIYYNMTNWSYFNDFPIQDNGTKFNPTSYDAHLKKDGDRNTSTLIDYPKIVQQYGTVDLVNQKEIDEVWFFGGAFFGEREASMAGPGAFYINGGVYGEVESNRPFVIYGFNYERGLAEMMHSTGHRAEDQIKRAYDNKWDFINPVTNWDKFTANVAQSNVDIYGVGSTHIPANGADHYNYDNDQKVISNALDFANYPNLTGRTTEISKNDWGATQEGYMRFWFNLLPKAEGVNADGRLNNWWKYIYDYTSYNIGGERITTGFERTSNLENKYLTEGMGTVFLFDMDDHFVNADVALPQLRTGVFNEGIQLYLIGSKVYAHIPENSAGTYYCFANIYDGDYRRNNEFRIYVGAAGYKTSPTTASIESSNYPNPFNIATTILYTLNESNPVTIKVYNSIGKQIEVLTDKTNQQQGEHRVNFDGTIYPSGIYYYSIQSGEDFSMHKMILLNN